MRIHTKDLSWYIKKLKNREYFSQGMYGDGEWIGIFDRKTGRANAEGTIYTQELRDALRESLNFESDNFIFSIPDVLQTDEVFGPHKIDDYLIKHGLEIEGYEKDVWDIASREAELAPLIQQLRKMNVCFVGNQDFIGKLDFINVWVPLDYPNCFYQRKDIKNKICSGRHFDVYLFAAGLPAAVFVQDVCKSKPNSFFIDVGSIFDGLIGIGAQRGWRAELYADKIKYRKWLEKNLKK